VDIARSWQARVDYRRGWDLSQGYTAPVFTNTVGASVGGFLNTRTDLVFSAGYSDGEVGILGRQPYTSWTGSAQFRYAINRVSAVTATYLVYSYDYTNPTGLPVGLPPHFDRQAFRVGVSFWVPLVGVFNGPTGAR
jgi:hypothetical protein